MLQIPIQPVPSQQVKVVLASQNCQIAIYQKVQGLFVDLNSNGIDISVGVQGHNAVQLDPREYSGFLGNLMFIDTQGLDDPTYAGFGTRFFLIYLTADEFALSKILNDQGHLGPNFNNFDLLLDDSGNLIFTDGGEVIIVASIGPSFGVLTDDLGNLVYTNGGEVEGIVVQIGV